MSNRIANFWAIFFITSMACQGECKGVNERPPYANTTCTYCWKTVRLCLGCRYESWLSVKEIESHIAPRRACAECIARYELIKLTPESTPQYFPNPIPGEASSLVFYR